MESTPPRPTVEALLSHARFVRGLARALLRDEHLAEDLEQDAWVAALERPPERGVRGWFRAVGRNLAAKALRSRERRGRREKAAARPEGVPGPSDLAAREAALREVLEAVLALDPLHREVVLLRFYEDLPPRGIAARLGVPVNTVRSRLLRAVAALRERLDVRHGGRRDGWVLAIGGLAGVDRGAAAGATAGGVAGATGVIMATGTKVALAATAALLLLAGGWWIAGSGEGGASVPPPAQGRVVAVRPAAAFPSPAPAQDGTAPPAKEEPPAAAAAATAAPVTGDPAGMEVSGVVVDEAGRPAPGATVRWWAQATANGTTKEDGTARTGPDGTFRFEATVTQATLRAEAEGYLPSDLVHARGTAGGTCRLRIALPARSAVLVGRVHDTGGLPLPKVVVGIILPPGIRQPGSELGPSVLTDELGRFRIGACPAAVQVEIYAVDGHHAPALSSATLDPGTEKELDLRMGEGATLVGTVRDAAGMPAPGVEVRRIAFPWEGYPISRTDGLGAYRFTGLTPEETTVTASDYRLGREKATVALKAGEETRLDLSLSTEPTLSGRVVDGTGAPLAGWSVMVRAEPLGFGGGDATTDGDGRFAVAGLEERGYRVQISRHRGALPVLDTAGVEPGPAPREFVVQEADLPSARIEGVLVDASGKPVSDARVTVFPDGPPDTWWSSGSCTLDRETGRFAGGPFPPRRYWIQVWSDSHGPRDLGARELAAGRTLDLGTVSLAAPGSLQASFTLEKGLPPIQYPWWTLYGRLPGGELRRVQTGELKGSLHMNLEPGGYRLRVVANFALGRQADFEVLAGQETRVELPLAHAEQRWLRVSGPGKPMAAAVVRARAYDRDGVLLSEQCCGAPQQRADSLLAFLYIGPGTYDLVLTPDRGEETRTEIVIGEKTGLFMDAPVEVVLR